MPAALSRAVVDRIWALRREGWVPHRIGRELGCGAETVRQYLNSRGGVPPRPQKVREASLTLDERVEIAVGLRAKESLRSIARRLGRAPSTISREVKSNAAGGYAFYYEPARAQRRAEANAARPKPAKLARGTELCALVEECLEMRWSPEQVAGWLRVSFPDQPERWVSHETIYQSLFVQSRGALRAELTQRLRTRRTARRPAAGNPGAHSRIVDPIPISERPPEAEDRAVPGHWEGDLLQIGPNTHVATLAERHSRFVQIVAVPNTTTAAVTAALAAKIQTLPAELTRTLTWDRGHEMAGHAKFTVSTGVKVYFADPHSPWQRGTNENTNGLLRDYWPKGTDHSGLTQADLDEVAHQLNTRPRQTLGWSTPQAVLQEALR